jgi:hypothetical protein
MRYLKLYLFSFHGGLILSGFLGFYGLVRRSRKESVIQGEFDPIFVYCCLFVMIVFPMIIAGVYLSKSKKWRNDRNRFKRTHTRQILNSSINLRDIKLLLKSLGYIKIKETGEAIFAQIPPGKTDKFDFFRRNLIVQIKNNKVLLEMWPANPLETLDFSLSSFKLLDLLEKSIRNYE